MFAFVLSIFGVGLLVFGTPTLLLAGFPLPTPWQHFCRFQSLSAFFRFEAVQRLGATFCSGAPFSVSQPLAAALFLVLYFEVRYSLNLMIAAILPFFAALRPAPNLADRVKVLGAPETARSARLPVTGVAHGLSNFGANLGGGLRTVSASSVRREKDRAGKPIVLCCPVFAASRLAVVILVLNGVVLNGVFYRPVILYAAAARLMFVTVGEYSLRRASNRLFDRLLGALMPVYAAVLFCRALQ